MVLFALSATSPERQGALENIMEPSREAGRWNKEKSWNEKKVRGCGGWELLHVVRGRGA
ncbi:7969_t:CDS:2, partial [Acaulospora colombiana]